MLCDSIDPKRRDKLHISSIGDSLNHGKRMALAAASAGGVSSGGEVRGEAGDTVSEEGVLVLIWSLPYSYPFFPVVLAKGRCGGRRRQTSMPWRPRRSSRS